MNSPSEGELPLKLLPSILVGAGIFLFSSVGYAEAADSAGITLSTQGEVWASESGAERRELSRRSPIFESDEIGTGPTSSAQFRMKDGARFTLSDNTRFLISEYRHLKSGDASDSAALELVEGTLRFVSGAIGKEQSEDWRLKAGNTSIGIRGTEGEVSLTGGEVQITIYDGRIVIFSPDCPEPVTIGKGTKFNYFKIDEFGCSASYIPIPFNPLAPDAFDVSPIEKETNEEATEGGGGGGGLASPN